MTATCETGTHWEYLQPAVFRKDVGLVTEHSLNNAAYQWKANFLTLDKIVQEGFLSSKIENSEFCIVQLLLGTTITLLENLLYVYLFVQGIFFTKAIYITVCDQIKHLTYK